MKHNSFLELNVETTNVQMFGAICWPDSISLGDVLDGVDHFRTEKEDGIKKQ